MTSTGSGSLDAWWAVRYDLTMRITADKIRPGDTVDGMLVQQVGWGERDGHQAIVLRLYGVASGRRKVLTVWPDREMEVGDRPEAGDPFEGL